MQGNQNGSNNILKCLNLGWIFTESELSDVPAGCFVVFLLQNDKSDRLSSELAHILWPISRTDTQQ